MTKLEIKLKGEMTPEMVIIDFFMSSNRINRHDAEEVYAAACEVGDHLGTKWFDEAIGIACRELDLNPDDLAKQIMDLKDTSNENLVVSIS